MGTTYVSPLMSDVENALAELASDNSRNGEPIYRWMRQILPYYQQYMCDFNRHSLMYCETGFRLSDRRVDEMQLLANGVGELNASLNRPLILEVRYDSLYKYLRALPEKLGPPSSVCEQLNAESLVSAELQRLYCAFLVMLDRVARDNHAVGYSTKTIFQFAKSSRMSNHFAKKIFDLCLGDTAMSRMNINTIRALRGRFDEFEAVFFPRYAMIVDENEESFGFSMRVFRRYIELPLLSEAEYRE